MASIRQFIDRHTDDSGRIRWPADEREREQLAQTLFGLNFIESLDGIVKVAEDWLFNPSPSRPYGPDFEQLWKLDEQFRTVFRTLTTDQRAAVSRLLRYSVSLALFEALAGIDQFPWGRFEISFTGEGEKMSVQLAPGWQYLHDRFFEWRRQFSDYPSDELPPPAA